jgi:peptide deformylase
MGLLRIRTYPDPVLREECRPVEVFDEELRQLAADMIETMHAAPGVGLAASQVGIEKRICVVDLSVGEDSRALHVLVNPEILRRQGSATDVEGCLSLPGITDKVTRPFEIDVRAQDLDGEEFVLQAEDWLARAVCHEVDHLDGVLFLDHLRGLRRERARRFLRRLEREEALA